MPKINQVLLYNGSGEVQIGKGCSFGSRLGAFHRGGSIGLQARYPSSKIMVGDRVSTNNNVWIGNNVKILKNTYIGDNSIVAAGAVVSGTFPKDVILGGVPANIIKQI